MRENKGEGGEEKRGRGGEKRGRRERMRVREVESRKGDEGGEN